MTISVDNKKSDVYLCTQYYYGNISSEGKYYLYEEYGGYNLIEYLHFKDYSIKFKDKMNLLNDLIIMVKDMKLYGNISGICDLSLENIVINLDTGKLKLIDLERILMNQKYSKFYVCKYEYMPMEMNLGSESTEGHDADKFDSWSIGIIIFRALFKYFPYYINMKQIDKWGYFDSNQHNFNIFEDYSKKTAFEKDIYRLLCKLFVHESERLTYQEFYKEWNILYKKYNQKHNNNLKTDKYNFLDYYSIKIYETMDISEADDDDYDSSDDTSTTMNNDKTNKATELELKDNVSLPSQNPALPPIGRTSISACSMYSFNDENAPEISLNNNISIKNGLSISDNLLPSKTLELNPTIDINSKDNDSNNCAT